MAIPVMSLPDLSNVASRPRKESLYDTEGVNNAVAVPAQITLFRDFGAFQVAGLALTKQQGRDTNVVGRSGLPKAQHLYWYSITHDIQPRQADLSGTVAGNFVVADEMRRLRQLCDWQFRFTDTPYVRQPLSEIPSGQGLASAGAATTVAATTILSWGLSWGVPARGNEFSITVGGRPAEITEVESFFVQVNCPELNPVPTVELYHQTHLRGILLKGITG